MRVGCGCLGGCLCLQQSISRLRKLVTLTSVFLSRRTSLMAASIHYYRIRYLLDEPVSKQRANSSFGDQSPP